MSRKILTETLFWTHLVIFIVWFALFFIPTSIWTERVVFHFWLIVLSVFSQLVMGLILIQYMHKYRIVCPLTSAMQILRGYKLNDPRNYNHSFVRELAARLKIHIPYGMVGFFIFLSLGVIIYQYILYLT